MNVVKKKFPSLQNLGVSLGLSTGHNAMPPENIYIERLTNHSHTFVASCFCVRVFNRVLL